jgi:hypothetical protein
MLARECIARLKPCDAVRCSEPFSRRAYSDASRLRLRVFRDGDFQDAVAPFRIDLLRIGGIRQYEATVKASESTFSS